VHRISKHGTTKVNTIRVVLPVEINLHAYRIMHEDALSAIEYKDITMDGIDELPESRFKVLREIEKEKLNVVKAFNKRVEEKSFQVNDIYGVENDFAFRNTT
jgi:hypothetical protein